MRLMLSRPVLTIGCPPPGRCRGAWLATVVMTVVMLTAGGAVADDDHTREETGRIGARAEPWTAMDPAANFERAMAAARAGDRSLARAWLEPLLIAPRISREGRARAYYLRGLMFYLDGLYVSAGQDYRRALEFLPTLAAARNALAWLHLKGRGVNPDPARAVTLYRLAARQGHTESRFNLALLLMKANGTARSPREALAWFEAAADDGHVEASALAGQLLARGDASSGLRANPERARQRLLEAAEAGHAGARLELGMLLVRTDPAGAERWLLAAASQGVAAAQTRLGHLYDNGGEGVPIDHGKALMWFREAAKQGDASAQSWLGWAYDAGVGVDPDPRQALRWYDRAARRNAAVARLNLAQIYQSGRGAPRSAEQALYWFEQAAEQGELSALSGLAWLLATSPTSELRDGPRAVELARRVVAREASAQALDVLAAALAETGQFEAAIDAQQRAIRELSETAREVVLEDGGEGADGRDGEARSNETGAQAFAIRLQRYRAGRPWRAD